MSGAIDFANLHDATLMQILVDWKSSSCEMRFKVANKARRILSITCVDISEVFLTHNSPWGGSDSVNRVTCEEERPLTTLDIEMQSGDTIRVRCATIDVPDQQD